MVTLRSSPYALNRAPARQSPVLHSCQASPTPTPRAASKAPPPARSPDMSPAITAWPALLWGAPSATIARQRRRKKRRRRLPTRRRKARATRQRLSRRRRSPDSRFSAGSHYAARPDRPPPPPPPDAGLTGIAERPNGRFCGLARVCARCWALATIAQQSASGIDVAARPFGMRSGCMRMTRRGDLVQELKEDARFALRQTPK
jgi:hypothetical protein